MCSARNAQVFWKRANKARTSRLLPYQLPINTDNTRLTARHQPRRRLFSNDLTANTWVQSAPWNITNSLSVAAPEQDEVDDSGPLSGLRVDGERAGVSQYWPARGTKVHKASICRSLPLSCLERSEWLGCWIQESRVVGSIPIQCMLWFFDSSVISFTPICIRILSCKWVPPLLGRYTPMY